MDPRQGSRSEKSLENVVFRGGHAVALLDFDFAAPGRPLFDLAAMARMCVPLDTPEDAAVWGRGSFDPFHRLRIVADAYGLPPGREELVRIIEPAFVEMWERMGGQARYDRRRAWFGANRDRFIEALK